MKFEQGKQYRATEDIHWGEINDPENPYSIKTATLKKGAVVEFIMWTGGYSTIAWFRTVSQGIDISFNTPRLSSKFEEI